MLRTLSAFLLVFCFLSLVVQQDGMAGLFGIASAALFALDRLVGKHMAEDRLPKARVGTIL